MEKIRKLWGMPKKNDFNFNRIGRFAAMDSGDTSHKLSQQTADDIDFYQLFSFVDRTTSPVGQQFLFKKLLHPVNTVAELIGLNERIDLMATDRVLREDIQKELIKLDQPDAYFICNHVAPQKVVQRPAWFRWLVINIVLVVSLAALSFKFPVCLILMIVPLTLNSIIHYWNKTNLLPVFGSFAELNILINAAANISKKAGYYDGAVKESLRDLKPFQWKLLLLNPGQDTSIKDDLNQIAFYFNEILKAFLLIEVFSVFYLTNELEKKKSSIKTLFDFIGEVDCAISIASLRAGALKTCLPHFVGTKKEMILKNLYHPLVENCVENSIVIRDKSVLITGSNMSGKTTFLRTLMINSILAQTIFTCFAEEFTTPFLRQFSSIRIDDSLMEGKSYFFEEVNVIGLLIEQAQSANQNLFILDEVFKGTNTTERTALAKAILSYLNRGNNIVIVSTHDMELSDMLKNEYDLCHFSETIENGKLHFDHRLKPGPLKTRNAIRLLELANFPGDIITEARLLSASKK
jgi:DNA mismatch repair ATPase MutS